MTKKLYSFAAITVLALTGCAPTSQISGASGQQTSAMQGNSASIGPSKAGGACGDNTGNCVSLLFTGDFLMHNMLWDQAQRDALAQGKSGLDFGPLIAEQKPYLDRTDLAVCQTETPVAPLEVPLCVLPNFQCPTPNTHSGLRSGLGCLYDSQQPCHRPGGGRRP